MVLSAGLTSHFKSENYAGFVVQFFKLLQDCHFNHMLVLCESWSSEVVVL